MLASRILDKLITAQGELEVVGHRSGHLDGKKPCISQPAEGGEETSAQASGVRGLELRRPPFLEFFPEFHQGDDLGAPGAFQNLLLE